jgi:hypothetical protein
MNFLRNPDWSLNRNTHLVISNAVLLVRRAQGNGWYDCPSASIWFRTDMDCPCAKAILLWFLRAIQVGMSVRG